MGIKTNCEVLFWTMDVSRKTLAWANKEVEHGPIKACNCDVEQNRKKTKCLHDIEAYSDRYLTCVVVPYHLFTLTLPWQRDCTLIG
jgi:hypothetical protein